MLDSSVLSCCNSPCYSWKGLAEYHKIT